MSAHPLATDLVDFANDTATEEEARSIVVHLGACKACRAKLANIRRSFEPPRCPYCDRVMSDRELAEQGACNDCYDPNPASDSTVA